MSLFKYFRSRHDKQKDYLVENLTIKRRQYPNYPAELDGIEIKGKDLDNLLTEVLNEERPIFHLLVPKEQYEEKHDMLLHNIGTESISLFDLSIGNVSNEFVSNYTPVRLKFTYNKFNHIFETSVLGLIDREKSLFLMEKPEKVLKERRSNQRYRVWPDIYAYFNNEKVIDISQSGTKIFSGHDYELNQTIKDALLTLPPVIDPQRGNVLYHGSEIKVPLAVIKHSHKQSGGYYYGIHFVKDVVGADKKEFNDFIFALRKFFLQSSTD